MNYELLFDKMNLWDEGRKSFYLFEKKRANDKAFSTGVDKALLAFDESVDAVKEALNSLSLESGDKLQELTLYVYLLRSEKTLEEYRKRDFEERIFYESMLDVTMAARRCFEHEGVYGIDEVYTGWSRKVLLLEIFRIGRLEFALVPSNYTCEIDGFTLEKGELSIGTHIPAYDKLTVENCEESYERARVFYKKHFGVERCFFTCASWMLHPWLKEDLGDSSAIVQFNSKYKVFEVVDDGVAPIVWVFKTKRENPNEYPEDTSIQRKLKARILEGRPFGYGVGVRL